MSLTGAMLGKGLIAPAEPMETAGSKKSINPASILKDPSKRLVILETFPILPQLDVMISNLDDLRNKRS